MPKRQPPKQPKSYKKKLSPAEIKKKVKEALCAGLSVSHIAKTLDITSTHVYNIRDSEEVQAALKEVERLKEEAWQARQDKFIEQSMDTWIEMQELADKALMAVLKEVAEDPKAFMLMEQSSTHEGVMKDEYGNIMVDNDGKPIPKLKELKEVSKRYDLKELVNVWKTLRAPFFNMQNKPDDV